MRPPHLLLLLLSHRFSAASLFPHTSIGSLWGTNIHFTAPSSPMELPLLSAAFRVARMDFTWSSIETTCGAYDFSAYDLLLASLTAVNVTPYWILDYSNPACYPPAAPGSRSCATPACIAGYARFAAAAGAHFRGRGVLWESVNEPNGMGGDPPAVIAALCAGAGGALRALGEAFVGPATAGVPLDYLASAIDAGLLSSVSGVSVHPYRAAAPEDALGDLAALRALLDAKGGAGLPILSGEWGYTSAEPPCAYGNRRDRATQGKYVPRMWFTTLLAGLTGVPQIHYDWKDDGANLTDCESNFGSITATADPGAPFSPKPAYLAALAAQRAVGGAAAAAGRVKGVVLDPPAAALNVTPASAFVLAFSGGSLPGGVAFAAWTNVSTCPQGGGGAPCGGAGTNASEGACLAAGCCFFGASSCTAPQPLAVACPASVELRRDCGFSGVSRAQCEGRGCCWDANEPAAGGPQCFFREPLGAVGAAFPVAPLPADTCFEASDVFGFDRGRVCAAAGAVRVALTDGPQYLRALV